MKHYLLLNGYLGVIDPDFDLMIADQDSKFIERIGQTGAIGIHPDALGVHDYDGVKDSKKDYEFTYRYTHEDFAEQLEHRRANRKEQETLMRQMNARRRNAIKRAAEEKSKAPTHFFNPPPYFDTTKVKWDRSAPFYRSPDGLRVVQTFEPPPHWIKMF